MYCTKVNKVSAGNVYFAPLPSTVLSNPIPIDVLTLKRVTS